ncbi:EAL domain-containing protein [Baaleninema sp.]|uniref:EAL domain-containing protein n=1 Tax=Baaleninema sp. TaxID=3101197 RepID=UPI003D068995
MSENSVTILLVEDNPAQARLLQEHLKSVRHTAFEWTSVSRLEGAIEALNARRFEVMLLDLTLPDSQGLESLDRIVAVAPELPVVVLTNADDDSLALDAVRLGAQDYLVKRHVNSELLAKSLRYAIERKQASEALRQANNALEERVRERTLELARANEQLKREIHERQGIEQALIHEKELAQVTLHSIGDAAISTDAEGRVQSLNPVAETLTGWTSEAAKGQALETVLRLWDEVTRNPVENLLDRVLRDGAYLDPLDHRLVGSNDTQEFCVELSAAPIRLHNGETLGDIVGAVLVCRDVTPARSLARQLSWQASHDPLTGLVNRREFERRLERAIEDGRSSEESHVMCYLDLDRFKIVNDTCGHSAGDELLRQISVLLHSNVRKTDLLARLGGDEFGLLLYRCSLKEARSVVEKLIDRVRAFRFLWQDKTFTIGVSIGLVEIDNRAESRAKVLSAADTAMYAAKEGGRNRFHVYQRDDRDIVRRHGDMEWVSRIVKALEEDRFCLYAQRIAPSDLQRRSRDRYELLLRMQDEDGNLVSPGEFMPAAEAYDLMPAIDRWVVRTLFAKLAIAGESPSDLKPLYMVNLSGASFNDEQFLAFLREQFWLHHVSPATICFEITETVAIRNLNQAAQFIYQLKQLGCCFALDDFGSGMSSLNYLKNLPVDYLKIDGHFIKNIEHDVIDAATIEAINHIGHVMGLQTIAEFVENDAILEKVRLLGVDFVQGYGIDKPKPFECQYATPRKTRSLKSPLRSSKKRPALVARAEPAIDV